MSIYTEGKRDNDKLRTERICSDCIHN